MIEIKLCGGSTETMQRIREVVQEVHKAMQWQEQRNKDATGMFTIFLGHQHYRALQMINQGDSLALYDEKFMTQKVVRVLEDNYCGVVLNTDIHGA